MRLLHAKFYAVSFIGDEVPDDSRHGQAGCSRWRFHSRPCTETDLQWSGKARCNPSARPTLFGWGSAGKVLRPRAAFRPC